jgi:hypothetical protein
MNKYGITFNNEDIFNLSKPIKYFICLADKLEEENNFTMQGVELVRTSLFNSKKRSKISIFYNGNKKFKDYFFIPSESLDNCLAFIKNASVRIKINHHGWFYYDLLKIEKRPKLLKDAIAVLDYCCDNLAPLKEEL